ncbi:MAG: UDP-glucose/GDP-mannose dehydrogenase family protein [Leptospiraceae bacterium]|nr:UDP-glucose/GDP-mannose dehydrogenase family protein [Leptospiraceae bacterium]
MKLTVVGTGYVGLVAGTCFAEYGNQVHCVDIDESKIERLKQGIMPIYEPGLSEMVIRNHERGRLHFTTDLADAVQKSTIIFIAVGTPDGGDGRPDLRYVLQVAEDVGRHLNSYKVIVNKSTVPVGTATRVRQAIEQYAKHEFDVVSNPEFLREGRAVGDFMHPERVIIGADSERAAGLMTELYSPFAQDTDSHDSRILTMNVRSAELTKYACNAFLALKVSFANEIANLCDLMGADYQHVKLGMGTDSRIGRKFLNAGIGYGGSCFPKDVRALVHLAEDINYDAPLIQEIENTNDRQKLRLVDIIRGHYAGESLKGKTFAVWGLAFKAGTDDMRDAPSIAIVKALLAEGVRIKASDPVAKETAQVEFGDSIEYTEMYDALNDADALLVLTEWPMYLEPDFDSMRAKLKQPLIFDGRNIYNRAAMDRLNFQYYSIGSGNNVKSAAGL